MSFSKETPKVSIKGWILLLVLSIAVGGCGGKVIVPSKPAELVIPPDLAKAFEVKELDPATFSSQPKQEEINTEKKRPEKKKRSRRGTKQAAKQVQTSAGDQPATSPYGIAGPGEMKFPIPNRRPTFDPVWVGEKVWLDVTWLNTKAGEFLLEVLPFKVINGRKVYDLKGTAKTSDLISMVYKAEDSIESFVDYEGWFPYKFTLHGDETKHIRTHLELYDHGEKKQYVHIHDHRVQTGEVNEIKGLKDLTPLTQDALSALYYVRTLKMEDGAVLRFPMTTSGSQWETAVTVLGREEVNTKMGYRRAIKTKVETRFNGVMQQQGDAFIWFSDDEHKHLLRFEAKVRIGWVAGIAKKIELGAPENMDHVSNQEPSKVIPIASTSKEHTEVTLGEASKLGRSGSTTQPSKEDKHNKKRMWFHQLMSAFSKQAETKK